MQYFCFSCSATLGPDNKIYTVVVTLPNGEKVFREYCLTCYRQLKATRELEKLVPL